MLIGRLLQWAYGQMYRVGSKQALAKRFTSKSQPLQHFLLFSYSIENIKNKKKLFARQQSTFPFRLNNYALIAQMT